MSPAKLIILLVSLLDVLFCLVFYALDAAVPLFQMAAYLHQLYLDFIEYVISAFLPSMKIYYDCSGTPINGWHQND